MAATGRLRSRLGSAECRKKQGAAALRNAFKAPPRVFNISLQTSFRAWNEVTRLRPACDCFVVQVSPARRWPVLLMARELGIGGTERQLTVTAKCLDRSLFEPHVGCFHDGFRGDELRAAGVPIVRLPVTSFKSPSVIKGARVMGKYLRQHGIELVHTFDTPLNVFGVPAAKWYRAPIVLSSQRAHRELSGGFRRLLRWTDRMVDGVVVNCQAIKRELVGEEALDPARVRLCYNGIDTTAFHPNGRDHMGGLTIGVVCALRPEKDLPTLLRAFQIAYNAMPMLKLQFVGSGPVLPELQYLARELGVIDACAFEPTTSRVADWMRKIDIFVLPSRSEALSNSLMEAMACGCAPIASDVGGNPELIVNGDSGLLFPMGDAEDLAGKILRLATNPSLRLGLAINAADRIRSEFSLERCARQMQAIYTEFLTGSKAVAARHL